MFSFPRKKNNANGQGTGLALCQVIGNKPLTEQMLTQIYVAMWPHHNNELIPTR